MIVTIKADQDAESKLTLALEPGAEALPLYSSAVRYSFDRSPHSPLPPRSAAIRSSAIALSRWPSLT